MFCIILWIFLWLALPKYYTLTLIKLNFYWKEGGKISVQKGMILKIFFNYFFYAAVSLIFFPTCHYWNLWIAHLSKPWSVLDKNITCLNQSIHHQKLQSVFLDIWVHSLIYTSPYMTHLQLVWKLINLCHKDLLFFLRNIFVQYITHYQL